MALEIKLNLFQLCGLKRRARKLGYACKPEQAFGEFCAFYDANKLWRVSESGHVMEIVVSFILGSIQQSLRKNGVRFWIDMNPEDDSEQIDFRLNEARIQLKFGWSDDAVKATQDELRHFGIKVVNIPRYHHGIDHDIIDDIVTMLKTAGLREKEIVVEIDDDQSLDTAERLWVWYCKGLR